MKYFLFNHAGCANHGCEAIVRGTQNIILNSDKNAEFVLSSYNAESDRKLEDIEIHSMRTRPLTKVETVIAAIDLKLNHSEKYALQKMYSPVVAEAADCDVCLSIGGDTYCYGDNHGVQVLTSELKKSGKKVVLWGASIGEDDLTDLKLASLKDFDAIFTREQLTFDLLKEKGVNENIFLFSDPAFCMERDEIEMPERFTRANTLGLNLSPLVASANPQIKDVAEKFIKYVLENTTMKILLIPHVAEEGNNDYEYMKPIFEKFANTERIDILPETLDAKQYKGYIANTRFFIGARTHATIAAYSSGVPTIVLGYSVKARGIAKDVFDEEMFVLDSKQVTYEQLKDAFTELVEKEDEIKEKLMRSIPLRMRSAMSAGSKLLKI